MPTLLNKKPKNDTHDLFEHSIFTTSILPLFYEISRVEHKDLFSVSSSFIKCHVLSIVNYIGEEGLGAYRMVIYYDANTTLNGHLEMVIHNSTIIGK